MRSFVPIILGSGLAAWLFFKTETFSLFGAKCYQFIGYPDRCILPQYYYGAWIVAFLFILIGVYRLGRRSA